MTLQKYIFWDRQHLAGYQKESDGMMVKLIPISTGMPQKWTAFFFNRLIETKQIEKITIPEYEMKVRRIKEAESFLAEFRVKEQYKNEQVL